MKIQTTTTTQTANKILGKEETTLYFLIIENIKGEKIIINVGKKTHEGVNTLIKGDTK